MSPLSQLFSDFLQVPVISTAAPSRVQVIEYSKRTAAAIGASQFGNVGDLRRWGALQGFHELVGTLAELSLPAFELAIDDFSEQIRVASDPVLYETLICDFSTTTPTIRMASEVVLMDCYSSYFTYALDCICGIPKITLLGSLQDWQRIRARIEVLETFDLGWWVARLRPILDEFVQTAEGRPTLNFWQAILWVLTGGADGEAWGAWELIAHSHLIRSSRQTFLKSESDAAGGVGTRVAIRLG